MLQSASSQVSN